MRPPTSQNRRRQSHLPAPRALASFRDFPFPPRASGECGLDKNLDSCADEIHSGADIYRVVVDGEAAECEPEESSESEDEDPAPAPAPAPASGGGSKKKKKDEGAIPGLSETDGIILILFLCILGCALCACLALAARAQMDGNEIDFEFEWPWKSSDKTYATTQPGVYDSAAASSRDGPNYNADRESGAWPASPDVEEEEYSYKKAPAYPRDDYTADMDMDMSDDESAYARS